MRIDYTGRNEIITSNTGINVKGPDQAKADSVARTSKQEEGQDRIDGASRGYGVTAATVEKALFSLESELEKVKQDAGSIDLDLIKTQMAVLSNTLTGEDAKHLHEKGYSLNDAQAETIVTVMDKIKMELAKSGMDISVFGDDLSMDQLEAMTGNAASAAQMASDLRQCGEGEIAYLTEHELEPTIENLYWAQHSGSSRKSSDTSMLEDANLRKQVEQIIQQAGLPVNETTLGYGELLLGNQIPLTPENISYADRLAHLNLPLEEAEIERAISQAVSEGRAPEEAYMMEGFSLGERAQAACQVVEQADDEVLEDVVSSGEPVTIESLGNAQKRREALTHEGFKEQKEPVTSGNAAEDGEGRLLAARRQLEEIRLMMTSQANYRLLKKGISIETRDLEQLVEDLKELENDYYKALMEEQGIEPTPENTSLFRETAEKTQALKWFPSYLIGRYLTDTPTVSQMYESGAALKASLDQANQAYETMMTAPRADLGDSIRKAFSNVDDILRDLSLEPTEVNQRAVRILAYNQMEITPEHIVQVKAADEKMQNLFRNMKPAVVMEMIREGINPLETDLNTLNQKAEEIGDRLDSGQEEKYSRYLWKLEQNQEISPEEKESYIGIYRLLRQIEKTDGAVIGAVVNQGGELSLRNLLTAVRSKKSRGLNITVNDEFGVAEEVHRKDLSISQQIEASYQTDCGKEAYQMLEPECLEQSVNTGEWQDLTPEELLWMMKGQQQARPEEEAYSYSRELELFEGNQRAEEAVLQILKDYNQPVDTWHILAAGQLIHNRNSVFRKLFDHEQMEQSPDLQAAKEKILQEFAEAVKTPEDMAKAQITLAETAERVMEGMINETDLSSLTVEELKITRTQIQLSSSMSKEENYAVPVLIADEMTNVQLKIVRGKKTRGMVDVLFETARMGKVAARFTVSEQRIEGFLASDREETVEQLRQQEEWLREQMTGEEGKELQFHYVKQENLDLAEFTRGQQNRIDGQQDSEEYQVQTKELYNMAKLFIETVKQAA